MYRVIECRIWNGAVANRGIENFYVSEWQVLNICIYIYPESITEMFAIKFTSTALPFLKP